MRIAYKITKENGKSKSVHRILMEKTLGRKLKYNEIIHHIDGNTYNNNIENLKLMTRSEHNKLHKFKKNKYMVLYCYKCGKKIIKRKKEYKYLKKIGQKNFYCSMKCTKHLLKLGRRDNKGNKQRREFIKQELKKGLTGYQIAKKLNINSSTVYYIIRNFKK